VRAMLAGMLLWGMMRACPWAGGGDAPLRPPARPVVGAIRWDAWHGDASPAGQAVERSLGPARWHYRLPFFGEEVSATEVRVRGDSQAVMDQEIACAAAAGLDYWAFVAYAPDSAMSRGLALYLSSRRKADIRFCLVLQGGHVGRGGVGGWPAQVARYVRLFQEPTYQRVAGGRPLIFLFLPDAMIGEGRFATWDAARAALGDLRKAALAAGLPPPYLVAQHPSPPWAKTCAERLGMDAVSTYATSFGGKRAPYADLAARTQRQWDEYRATGAKVVPLVTAGWDRRPRVEHPVPWEKPGGDPNEYYEPPKPPELAAHLKAALDWTAAHPEAAEARAVLIYGWNELDEGGWLVPTKAEGTRRLDALAEVLKR
jgi:hypothetical protein